MSTPDGRYWVTYNGEIYNFMELRSELESRGYQFRSRSDTEVLLALYADEGPKMLHRLRGMFAFGIWDGLTRRLWLARDRIGIKPLYYTTHAGRFLFASEIKALLAFPGIHRAVDVEGLYHYLSSGVDIGCRPAELGSRIARRRCPRPIRPSVDT